MVAVIKTGHSIHRILNYNENKVKAGMAECIGEGNYPADVEKMSFNMKLNRLLKQAALNENVTRNSVHISLNFDAADTGLSKEKLVQIADVYMQKIGFGEQPYLIYQHFDAGHPHIHLVSIKVRKDGTRIDMQNIGRNQSEKARIEMEQSFGLVAADDHKKSAAFRLKPVDTGRILYGRMETKRAITNVLDAVLDKYKYTSLPELNAILKQYNVMADRGREDSRVYAHNGLLYRVLDTNGKPVGIPIKASSFYNKPTLEFLGKKFRENEQKRMPFRSRVKNAVDTALHTKKISMAEMEKTLERQGIHVVLRRNEQGLLYGVTYVDHQTKCIFNGSDLGKQYSAKALQERCLPERVPGQDLPAHPAPGQSMGLQPQATTAAETKAYPNELQPGDISKDRSHIIEALIQPEQVFDYIPGSLKRKNRKKKKRKNISGNQ